MSSGTSFGTMGEVSNSKSIFMRPGDEWSVGALSDAKKREVCSALRLNQDLFTFIVCKLDMPLQEIFRLCCSCKTWKTFFTERDFVRCFFESLSQTPLYSFRAYNGLAAYDIRIRNWQKWTSAVHSEHFSAYNVCGAAGDWLLVKEKWGWKYDRFLPGLCLANPRKGFLRRLPDFPVGKNRKPQAIGVTLDESSKICNVYAVNRLSDYGHKVYLYDFKLNSWEAFGTCQRGDRERITGMTFYAGTLHCIINTTDAGGRFCISEKICRFDGRKSRWQELSAQVSARVHLQHLFQSQGHLMLIGGPKGKRHLDSSSASYSLASVHIWQLDKERHVWVEIMRMPDHLVDYLFPAGIDLFHYGFNCATCKDQICLRSYIAVSQPDSTSKCMIRYVMCDLSKALWWDVPEPPFTYFDCVGFSAFLPKLELEKL